MDELIVFGMMKKVTIVLDGPRVGFSAQFYAKSLGLLIFTPSLSAVRTCSLDIYHTFLTQMSFYQQHRALSELGLPTVDEMYTI